MLHHLVSYAQKYGIDSEPGFEPAGVRWAIQCAPDGRYLGIIELGDADSKKNRGRKFLKTPRLSFSEIKTSEIRSHFLVETADVVVGYGRDANSEKTVRKHGYFVGLLDQASSAMPVLGAVARMLDSEDNLVNLRADLEEHKAAATDKVTLQIDGTFPVESAVWHEWWRNFRRGLETSKVRSRHRTREKMLCFLTGEAVEPTATNPKISGLTSVGGLAMGDLLISFKQESFCSYGLEQSANAAMSELAAKAYQAGLTDLISNHSALLAGTVVTHWFRNRVAPEEDPFDWLNDPSDVEELNAQTRARSLMESIRNGERPHLADNTYFALTMSANGGRVVIRDWMEGSFEELVANVDRWFSDLEIIHPRGRRIAPPLKFSSILAPLRQGSSRAPAYAAAEAGGFAKDSRKNEDVRALAPKLYRAAIRGEPIQLAAMLRALARVRADIMVSKEDKSDQTKQEWANSARVALIKAYHLRKQRKGGGSVEEQLQLKAELNARLKDRAYHCGRLMAVLGKVQTSALGEVGAGVIQRFYAAASATPALVFGRLVRGAQFHLNKIADRDVVDAYEQQIGEICCKIGKPMPTTLNLEDQSLFALGYYQQLAACWAGKDESEKETE